MASAAFSLAPLSPWTRGSSARITRHADGSASRDSNAAAEPSARGPPSSSRPPWSKPAMPTPERAPRPSSAAIAPLSRPRSNSVQKARPVASASCVPEPSPECTGGALRSTRCTGARQRVASRRVRRWSTARASAASPPSNASNASRDERPISTTVSRPSTTSPMLPNRRPRVAAGSRKPRCRRAGAATRMRCGDQVDTVADEPPAATVASPVRITLHHRAGCPARARHR